MANYYAPQHVNCPSERLMREAGTPQAKNQTLHPSEQKYVRARKQIAKQSMQSWLGPNMTEVYSGDFSKLSVDDAPNIAISVSGGNYRAALFGAASLEAFDARVRSSVDAGLGGLLQSSAYITGLSGGSYLTTSLMFNEFPVLSDLVFGNDTSGIPGWQLDVNLFEPGPSGEYADIFFTHLYDDLGAKQSQGFPVTFCDFWGRALSYHFLPGTNGTQSFASNTTAGNHAASLSYSSATQLQTWKDQTMPFPIVVIDEYSPQAQGKAFGDTGDLPLTSVVYELTPFEFGSYDPQLAAFVELPYLGSTFHGGAPSSCVNSFDNAGLMIGTSSCTFHQYNVTDSIYWKDTFEPLIANLTKVFGEREPGQEMDVTSVANPFYGMHAGTYQDAQETNLSLLDGSLDVENIPLLPLLVKARGLDAVVVLDSSGETNDTKPEGLSLLATKEKAVVLPSGTINFPTPFPNSTDEFISKGLNVRPVFFGCDGPTNQEEAFPLFVYIPNADPTGVTNISTAMLALPVANQTDIFAHGQILASRGYVDNDNLLDHDDEWGLCVACATVERARARTGAKRTQVCDGCFERYCYTGQNMTGGGTASASMASASATSKFVHDSGALMRGAVASSPSPSVGVSQADAHALLRNEYIIMGGLGVVLVLLIAIFGVLAHGRRKAKAGYSVVGTGEGKF